MDNVEDSECERRRKDEEVDFWKRKFLELQNRFVIQKESEFKITALLDKLDDYKIMHDALHVELQEKNADIVAVEGKLKESTAARVFAENELNQNKILHDKLKEECTRRFKDLEFQADSRLKYELDMEKKLEGYTKKYDELCVRFREMKEREVFLENELREYKQMCVKLKEQIGSLEEEKKALVEREKKEQERITLLEEEDNKMMKCNEVEKMNQLNEENDKIRAEDDTEDTEVLKSKIRQLETRADYYMNNGTELGKELEDYRMKCNSLTLELKEKEMKYVWLEDQLRNLMSIKVAIDNEIEGYKTAFTGMKEHIVGLSEDREVSCIREKQLQERITYLEEVVRKTGTGREAETQVLRLDEDNSASKLLVSHGNRERASEPIGLQNKEKNSINERLCSEMDGATVALPSTDEEKLLGNTDINFTSVFPPSCNPTSLHGNISEHVSGTYDIVKDEKMNTALASRVELVTMVEKKIGHELKGRSSDKLLIPEQSSVRTLLRGVNETDGSDIGKEISPDHTCNITDKEMHQLKTDAASQRFLLNEDNLTPNKCLKRPLSDMRCEEYESIFEEDETLIPLTATAKRSRTTEAIISRTKSEDDVPIPVGSTVNICARGQKMENSISSSRSRSVPPRQCPGQSYCADSTIKHLHKVNVVGKVGSDDSEDKCWHGICVKNSDSSGSGDSSSESEDSKCTDWSFEQVLAKIKRNRLRESKWQFEADMLSSFEEDPELCMKAVCALYRQQISFNKLEKGSSCSNSRGFNEYDALRGIALAEFLMDGNQEGDLNKSLKDLEMFDLKAVADCKRFAANYSRQLFNIYQKKEDPFFAPT